jgi:hypothetical protein
MAVKGFGVGKIRLLKATNELYHYYISYKLYNKGKTKGIESKQPYQNVYSLFGFL